MPYTRLDSNAKGSTSHLITPTNPPRDSSDSSSSARPVTSTPMHVYAAPGPLHERYDGRTSVILGAIQIAGGILAILDQIILYYIKSISMFISGGIWCGIPYIIAGSFGVAAGKTKTYCLIVTYKVLTIIFCVLSIGLLISSALALAHDERSLRYRYQHHDWANGSHTLTIDPKYYHYLVISEVVNSLQLIVVVCELVTMIWGSALACKVTCCAPQQQIPLAAQVKYENGQTILVLGAAPTLQVEEGPGQQPGQQQSTTTTQDGAINTTLQAEDQNSQLV